MVAVFFDKHKVLGSDVAVHYASDVNVVQCLENLKHQSLKKRLMDRAHIVHQILVQVIAGEKLLNDVQVLLTFIAFKELYYVWMVHSFHKVDFE